MDVRKVDKYSIEITKDEIVTKTNTYERNFIEKQIKQITTQKIRDNAQRDLEIQNCLDILVSMDSLKIISNPKTLDISGVVEEVLVP